ncbi:lysophospholipid acyltransferase family protein [Pedobacter helvus]|uniref:Lysophospholipid acyltransferase family protein n=1 Tax=Pedobacter helvus TaxID=2563444 RepID=A0ABW9JE97_9SPHI|nr:lysophospholipid acyltransferase family protein [Pedobacter ureilyticus]
MIKKGFLHIGIFFLHLISFLPMWFLFGVANMLYYLLYYVIGYRRAVVRKNLMLSFPEKNTAEIIKIEKRFYRNLTDIMVEIVKMSSISKAELLKRVKMKNFEMVEDYFRRGESALACTGHYGNWELGMMAAGLKFSAKSHVIYKPINNKVFENWFNTLRTKFGNIFVPMKQTLRDVVATKNDITLFCFASDQSPRGRDAHHLLTFLNQRTAVLLGLEKIAKQTNRPIFYFDFRRIKRGYYEIECLPMCLNPNETEPFEITALFFKNLTKTIEREPGDWLWSHRRWKIND